MNIRSAFITVSTSAAVLAATLLAAGPSIASGHTGLLSHPTGGTPPPAANHLVGKGACFSNLVDASEVGITSQNFGSGNALDAQGADDFRLAKKCRVSTVGIDSRVYNGVADSFNVTFYKNKHGLPGKVVATATSSKVTSCPSGVACDTAITLPSPVTLKKGVGWVSVQANLDAGQGQFVWLTGQTQTGKPAVWQNPGDGWGTGCTTWATIQSCWSVLNPGPEFEFVLLT